MNIKEYISSGIVESYVLGLTTNEENLEFEQLCRQYPELVAARTQFELELEKQVLSAGITPPTTVKEDLQTIIQGKSKPAPVIELAAIKRSSSYKWAAAAAIILLLTSAWFAYTFYTQNQKLESELAQSREDQKQLDERLKKLEMVEDPNVAVVNLKGTEKAPKSSASIYWDSTSSSVYLVAKNMPKPASDKQYQLWAIITGTDGQLQPTSLGLFDVGEDGKVILKMENVKKADAFAITIEKRGNTGGPTLEQLQTMGKTSL